MMSSIGHAAMKRRMPAFGLALLLWGCATAGPVDVRDEDADLQIQGWTNALVNQDLDAIMASVSERFSHPEWRTKADVERFLAGLIREALLDNLQIITRDAARQRRGNVLVLSPIEMVGAFGAATVELEFMFERGRWLITGVDAWNIL